MCLNLCGAVLGSFNYYSKNKKYYYSFDIKWEWELLLIMKTPDIILKGSDNGEGMIIHCKTKKGTDIFALAIPNIYEGENWDLGPTWCYLILGKKNILIDTGRFGNYGLFKTLLKTIDKKPSDIDRIIVTHSHEDHDGNIWDIISANEVEIWAHPIYSQMISYHTNIENGARHPELPGSCRLCFMPDKFISSCKQYLYNRSLLNIDFDIEDNLYISEDNLRFIHTPGHSADSICIILEDEVIFTGDTILPGITPRPTMEAAFKYDRLILPEEYRKENMLYGLMTYIKSLNKIMKLESQHLETILPSHRLFYKKKFNLLDSAPQRANEIIQFHIDRCHSILEIIDKRPLSINDIVVEHFDASLLIGSGKKMAKLEILAHIEILKKYGDICYVDEKNRIPKSTGTINFLKHLNEALDN